MLCVPLIPWLIVLILCQLCLGGNDNGPWIEEAMNLLQNGQVDAAKGILHTILSKNPTDFDSLYVLGSVHAGSDQYEEAVLLFERAFQSHPTLINLSAYANYLQSLRALKRTDDAKLFIDRILPSIQHSSPKQSDSYFFTTVSILQRDFLNYHLSAEFAENAVQLDASDIRAWKSWIDSLISLQDYAKSLQIAQMAVQAVPDAAELWYSIGLSYHMQKQFEKAIKYYQIALNLAPNLMHMRANYAAAYQELGDYDKAYQEYLLIMPHVPNDAAIRNNFGILLGTMGRNEEEEYWLLDSLRINPNFTHALGNLGGYYQDEGMLHDAEYFLQRSIENGADYRKTKVQIATLLSPLHTSWEQMRLERRNFVLRVTELIDDDVKLNQSKGVNNYDRVHFYLSFHGLNDRPLQELVARAYSLHLNNVDFVVPRLLIEPEYAVTTSLIVAEKRKIRVGFISKFFGIFEPHGMLLDGTMAYLPRDQFEVICFLVIRSDGKPVSPIIRSACHEMYEVSLSLEHAQQMLLDIPIDVLIFADTNCEPITHFLSYTRHAPIQIGFWGTPITSGSKYMDYFISAAAMESPHRTRMPSSDDPYSEQVILLDGQGIWYYRPVDPDLVIVQSNLTGKIQKARNYTRDEFNIPNDCFLFLMPQSTFKIHPLFDLVLKEVMLSNDRIHLAVTGGRRPRWTQIYISRLQSTLGPVLSDRLHVIERVSSECFYNLLVLADAVLHPFPFDGSRTSADVLTILKPYVTLPTEYLKGRMGYSFFRTMNIPELVAVDIQDYIQIAHRLVVDQVFYHQVVQKIKENVDLIWEDMEFPYGITVFLQRLLGLKVSSYDEFLREAGRNVSEEIQRTEQRQQNQHLFDQQFGFDEQRWQLQETGVLRLPSLPTNTDDWPRIFDHWRQQQRRSINTLLKEQISSQPQQKEDDHAPLWLKQFRRLSRKGEFSEAFQVVRSLQAMDPSALPMSDPVFLLELGSLQFFRGEYQDALNLCSIAADLSPQLVESFGCMGVAAMYLPEHQNRSIDLLYKTFVMKRTLLLDHPEEDSIKASPVFSMPMDSIVFNLIAALTSLKQFNLCGQVASEVLSLPPYDQGGMHLIVFAFMKWSESGRRILEQYLLQHYTFGKGIDLRREIRRIQREGDLWLNNINLCLSYASNYEQLHKAAMTDLINIIDDLRQQQQNITNNQSTRSSFQLKIALVTQFFTSSDPVVLRELSIVLQKNLLNPAIDEIHLLTEQQLQFANFSSSEKITQKVIGHRLTFQEAFQYANDVLFGKRVIIANADIYFDRSLLKVKKSQHLTRNKVLALLKWTQSSVDGETALSLRTDMQDAWIFNSPISQAVVNKSAFLFGVPRCDNRLAEVLHEAGYEVYNPALDVHAIELYSAGRLKTLYGLNGSVPGEVRNVYIDDLFKL